MNELTMKLMEGANKANYELGRAEFMISELYKKIAHDQYISEGMLEEARKISESVDQIFARISNEGN